MALFIVINGRSCPEEYRELQRRNDDSSSDSDDDDQWREDVCQKAMDLASRQPNSNKNRLILRTYCAHYDEALELGRENNDAACENKKRAIAIKRKRQQLKKKRDDDDSSDDDDDKRRALRRRELNKRIALRFIHKRMS